MKIPIGEALYAEAQERLLEEINAGANTRGWFISQIGFADTMEFQLQFDDESAMFNDDEAAWEHVYHIAQADPSGPEMKALRWLERMGAPDFRRICKHMAAFGPLPEASSSPPIMATQETRPCPATWWNGA